MTDHGSDYTQNSEQNAEVQGQRKHVFVVNGNAPFLNVMRELLQDEHYNVTTTNFVPNTFDQIRALDPDLVVIDLALGQPSGLRLLDSLEQGEATSVIPVIVTSASQELLYRLETERPGFTAHTILLKPVNLDVIVSAITERIGPS